MGSPDHQAHAAFLCIVWQCVKRVADVLGPVTLAIREAGLKLGVMLLSIHVG